jgi:hypothetical protein
MIEFRPNPPPMPSARQLSCRKVAVSRIADAIRELAGSGEPITEDAFIARGIPPAIVARYANEARQVARRSFVKQV